MNINQIDRMVATIPTNVEGRQRARIDGYAAAARRCEERICALRADLEQALRALGDAAHAGGPCEEPADRALDTARELDSLERVQPRIDAWLRVAVSALSDEPLAAPSFGEGPT